MRNFQWMYPESNRALLESIAQEFKIHPAIAETLVSRGFTNLRIIHDFLYGKLPNLYDPNLFADMPVAVKRVLKAVEQKQNILIYGDNDVDGMSAAALLTEFLRKLGSKVYFEIPNRSSLKKSLIGDALEVALKFECKLLITVDCGITAAKEIGEVAAHGIDVIITACIFMASVS